MACEFISIDKNSWRIEDADGMVRCLLFIGTTHALLIDTGVTGEVTPALIREKTDLPIILVNTHSDDDHTGGNASFDATHMHPAEFSFYKAQKVPQTNTIPIWDGDIIDIGGRSFEVILVPGHTPGSIALLDSKNRILITGDSVALSPVFILDPPGFSGIRSISAFISSMDRLQSRITDFDELYTSHGPFPASISQIGVLKRAAEKLGAGELKGVEPPFDAPGKVYEYEGGAFIY